MQSDRKLDDVDRNIIGILQANAREPIASLARKIELSRSAAQERIARLERHGVISSYTVQLGNSKVKPNVSAYMLLYLEGPICERILPSIAAIPEVRKSQSVGGEIDMILLVETNSLEELYGVRARVEAIRGVSKVTSGIVLVDRFDRTGRAKPEPGIHKVVLEERWIPGCRCAAPRMTTL